MTVNGESNTTTSPTPAHYVSQRYNYYSNVSRKNSIEIIMETLNIHLCPFSSKCHRTKSKGSGLIRGEFDGDGPIVVIFSMVIIDILVEPEGDIPTDALDC